MDEPKRAKVFWSGRSQAVRLPLEFRFQGEEVLIRREGSRVVLEPIEKPEWPEGFWERLDRMGPISGDFVRPEPLPESPARDALLAPFASQDEAK